MPTGIETSDPTRFFAGNYFEADARFVEAAADLGWSLEFMHVAVPESVRNGMSAVLPVADTAKLRLTVALSPRPAGPHRTLVLSIGLHGVEGFFGSAVLLQQLEVWRRTGLPEKLRVICLHAMNPFGFAMLRRADEHNRDLNRNFIKSWLADSNVHRETDELGRKLNRLLNPSRRPSCFDGFLFRAMFYVVRFGFRRLQSAIACGQYQYPQGLFYGGSETSDLAKWLETQLPVWFAESKRVVHLDFHTGLGRSGEYQLLFESQLADQYRAQLRHLLGSERVVDVRSSNSTYQANGSFAPWMTKHSSVKDTISTVAEFGTYGPIRVISALRRENQHFHYGSASDQPQPDSGYAAAKRELLEVFCPSSPIWRLKVLKNARGLVDAMQSFVLSE